MNDVVVEWPDLEEFRRALAKLIAKLPKEPQP